MQKKSALPRAVIYLGAAVIALLLLFATNPSAATHRRHIRDAFGNAHPVANLFGLGSVSAAAVAYHSDGLWSYTEFDGRKVSYGALGMVFVDN